MTKYSYFDDFTNEEREKMRLKMIEEKQTWDEILERFGHPKDWPKAEQLEMF